MHRFAYQYESMHTLQKPAVVTCLATYRDVRMHCNIRSIALRLAIPVLAIFVIFARDDPTEVCSSGTASLEVTQLV